MTVCRYEHAVMSVIITSFPPNALLLLVYFILAKTVDTFEGPVPSYKLTGIVLFPC
jgi:hypothetical protein